jgi:hypothetical protein
MVTDKERGEWRDPKASKAPFSDVADTHLTRKINLRPRTAEKYRSSLRCYLDPAFGRMPVGVITRDDVQNWVSGLVREGLAPETVRGHYALMVAIMKRAAEGGRIPKSPSTYPPPVEQSNASSTSTRSRGWRQRPQMGTAHWCTWRLISACGGKRAQGSAGA